MIPDTAQPPSKEKLLLFLKNGRGDVDFVDMAIAFIKKFDMPFCVEQLDDGTWVLKDKYSRGDLHLQKFITRDPETMQMKSDASKVSRTDYEVLITGETGTGKEILAKSMIGSRLGEIKALNCAGFPEQLVESELFGYVKDAFTGANQSREGLISAASKGVLFMDEIGELPMVMQAKLLRVLQEKTVRKVGGKVEEEINCKFVFATNRDLKEMVKLGTFRKDLYARISTLEFDIKPLAKRVCDIVPIVESLPDGKEFLTRFESQLTSGALELPYNVRSLQQYVIRYKVFGHI
jgi:transcriptional regulator with PAS, ATPase and Fis domain